MPRIFVVSAVPAVRAGLRALIEAADDCQVVGVGDQLPGPERETEMDVVVVDAEPDLDAGELLAHQDDRAAPIVLGPVRDERLLADSLAGRPWGYLPRNASAESLIAAIRSVASGLTVVDPSLGSPLAGRVAPGGGALKTPDEDLTPRELEVLRLVALGLSNKEIASRLVISEHTAKFHVAAILSKLGASSRTEAVHLAAQRGLVAL
jgi:DNA-binding NarL/FixJ family response regulator